MRKLYIDPKKVLVRLQINKDLDGADRVVASAIQGAQTHIEGVLDSQFERRTWTTTFFLDDQAFSGLKPNGQFRMELPSGFVRMDNPPIVTYDTLGDWRMANAALVPTSDYMVDPLRGIIYIDARSYSEKYIQIQFDSGFKGMAPEGEDVQVVQDILVRAVTEAIGGG